jgi:hypothetical protein
MKAKDLAALAALGIAGKFAYDKYNEKNAPASGVSPPGAKLGDRVSPINEDVEGEAQTRMDNYSNEGRGKTAKFADEDYSNEGRGKAAPDYSNEGRGKAAPDYSNEGRGKVAPIAVASPVRTPVVQTRSLAAAQAQPIYDNDAPVVLQKPDATRVTPYNSDIMYAPTVKSDPNVVHDDEMNRLARTRATRQGTVVAQSPNDQAQARILRQGPTPAQSATNAQAQARMLRQGTPSAQIAAPVAPAAQTGRYTKDQYGNIIDNTTGKVSSTIFSAGQQGNAARNGMKRGGVVKMAKGGLASSKMSKPSGASRGDGIAQRGRTRGKYL